MSAKAALLCYYDIIYIQNAKRRPATITFSCPFARYQLLPDDIFFLYQGELQIAQAYSLWFCNTVALYGGWAAIASTPHGTTVDIFIPQEMPPL